MNAPYTIARLSLESDQSITPAGVFELSHIQPTLLERLVSAAVNEIRKGGLIFSVKWRGMNNTPSGADLGGLVIGHIDFSRNSMRGDVRSDDDSRVGVCQVLNEYSLVGMHDRHVLITLYPAFAFRLKKP